MRSLSEEDFYDVIDEDSDNEIEEVGGLVEGVERRQLKQAMKESHEMAWRSAKELILMAVVRSLQDQGLTVNCVGV